MLFGRGGGFSDVIMGGDVSDVIMAGDVIIGRDVMTGERVDVGMVGRYVGCDVTGTCGNDIGEYGDVVSRDVTDGSCDVMDKLGGTDDAIDIP